MSPENSISGFIYDISRVGYGSFPGVFTVEDNQADIKTTFGYIVKSFTGYFLLLATIPKF